MSHYHVNGVGIIFGNPSRTYTVPTSGGTPVGGQDVEFFYYLNSLYNHSVGTGTVNTYVSNWLGRFSDQAPTPNVITFGQQFGFAEEWSNQPQISGNTALMETTQGPVNFSADWIGAERIDRVGFVADNFFGKDVAPDQPNVGGWNYITELLRIIDGWETNVPNPSRVYMIYSSWTSLRNDAGLVVPNGALEEGAVNEPGKQAWYTHNQDVYEPWNALIVSMLQAARPTLNIRLHEVGKALRILHRDFAPVHDMNMTALFFDGSHGTPSWYCMAAIAEYICQFDEKPPAGFVFDPAWGVNATVSSNYQAIVDHIWGVLRP